MNDKEELDVALAHHRAGRLREAESIYRQILAQRPNDADTLHLLGVLAAQAGRPDAAVDLISQAIGVGSTNPIFFINLGNAQTDMGRPGDALESYRHAIRLEPGRVDAHINLGNAFQAMGDFQNAIASYRNAIQLSPNLPVAYGNLGSALRSAGKPHEAIAACRRAIQLASNHAEAYANLANALKDVGQIDEAIAAFREALRVKPSLAAAQNNLANTLNELGRLEEAVACYREAIRFQPNFSAAHNNLGNALQALGQLDPAAAAYRQAIHLDPKFAEAHANLGNVLCESRNTDEAIASYERAIQLKPDYAEAHSNLGLALADKGRLDESLASLRRAIELSPDFPQAYNNLGNSLKDMGRLEEAIASYRKAIQLKPDHASAHSNLVYTIHFDPAFDAGMIYQEHRAWNDLHAKPLRKFVALHKNDRRADRPLRIGYVSPDFRQHAVGRFLYPLIAAHDRENFEIYCYADVRRPDALTELFCQGAIHWRNIVGLSDQAVAKLVLEDQIDVLVDLTMHMARNRMLMFARKPAPVQVTYLAYCSTTGLETIDYRLTDPYLDPPAATDNVYSEKSIRLPETYWCYSPQVPSPEITPSPSLGSGQVTFGCLNNFCKVSPPALDVWIEILQKISNSRLILHAHEGSHRQRVWDVLQSRGIDPRRLEFIGRIPLYDYLQLHQQIDIALDPFPCNGGTTTCDALWMGVPVITLIGRTAVGRGGVSVLHNIGLPELIAESTERYVQIAEDLAGNPARLSELRQGMRDRMRASPLMDPARFARNVEAAYRQMWRTWCSNPE